MSRIFDVTIPLSAELPTYPGDPPFEFRFVQRLEGGDPANVGQIRLGTHAGTHVDAPSHFLRGGATVDQLPLEILTGKARVVAIPASCDRIDVDDIRGIDLSDEIRVLFRTRNSGLLRRPVFEESFVHLTPGAASYLVQSGLKLVGVDYLSVDGFGSHDFPVHQTLLGAGVVVVEGLDLSDVEPGEYDLTCLPLRIAGGDASPVRALLRRRA